MIIEKYFFIITFIMGHQLPDYSLPRLSQDSLLKTFYTFVDSVWITKPMRRDTAGI